MQAGAGMVAGVLGGTIGVGMLVGVMDGIIGAGTMVTVEIPTELPIIMDEEVHYYITIT